MGVRKIFIVLVTIVICVIIGAFAINTLMPNTVKAVVNATEDMIYNATGLVFDLNGDANVGNESLRGNTTNYTGSSNVNEQSSSVQGNVVTGWETNSGTED